jgi:hypothetical protein
LSERFEAITSEEKSVELAIPHSVNIFYLRCYFQNPEQLNIVRVGVPASIIGTVDGVHSFMLTLSDCVIAR